MRWLTAVLVGMIVVVGTGGSWAAADPTVDQQAWVHTGTTTSFSPQQGEIYVAMTGGKEEARGLVHLNLSGLSSTAVGSSALTLTEASDGLLSSTAALNACALTAPFTGSGQIPNSPPTDNTHCTSAASDGSGTWTIELNVFASLWAGGEDDGLALIPVGSTPVTTFRVSFDTSKTKLITTPGSSALTQPDNPSPDGSLPGTPPGAESTPVPSGSAVGLQPANAVSPALSPTVPASTFNGVPPPSRRGIPAAGARTVAIPAALLSEGASSPGAVLLSIVLVCIITAALVVAGTFAKRRVIGAEPSGQISGSSAIAPTILLLIVLLPLLGREVIVYKAGVVLIFFVAAIGLHVLVNWAGELSLAQASMVGIPAFASLSLSGNFGISPIYLLPAAVVLGAFTGCVVAFPALRTRGLQIALVTLVAGVALDRFFFNQTWLVGGANGGAAAVPTLGPLHLSTSRALYPVLVAAVVVAVLAAWILMHSKVHRAWSWIRSDESAASAFGVPVARYRIAAYAIGGAFGGLAGGLTVMWVQRLGPSAFPDTLSFTYLVLAVLAGPGFLGGLAFAALTLQGGQQFSDDLFGLNAGRFVTTLLTYAGGFGLIFMIARHQAGFNGLGRSLMERIRRNRISPYRASAPGQQAKGPSLSLVAGVVAIVAGFIAIWIAWHHASQTNQLWVQNQLLISGGLAGLGLILLGGCLLIRDRLGANQTRLTRELASLLSSRDHESLLSTSTDGQLAPMADDTTEIETPVVATPRRKGTTTKPPRSRVSTAQASHK